MHQRQASKAANEIVASLAVSSSGPLALVRAAAPAGSGRTRVAFDIMHSVKTKKTDAEVATALASVLGNGVEMVSESLSVIEGNALRTAYTAVVVPRHESQAATPEALSSMQSLSSNMFLDEEHNMWNLRRSETGELLVRANGLDDDSLLFRHITSCSSSDSLPNAERRFYEATAKAESVSLNGHDFITYVNSEGSVAHGFVMSVTEKQGIVAPIASNSADVVDAAAVLQKHDIAEFPEPKLDDSDRLNVEVAMASGRASVETLLAYYKKIYSADPAFYEKFAERIRSNAR